MRYKTMNKVIDKIREILDLHIKCSHSFSVFVRNLGLAVGAEPTGKSFVGLNMLGGKTDIYTTDEWKYAIVRHIREMAISAAMGRNHMGNNTCSDCIRWAPVKGSENTIGVCTEELSKRNGIVFGCGAIACSMIQFKREPVGEYSCGVDEE